MKIYETEPETITVDGRIYRYKAPFDTVLFVLDVLRNGQMLTKDRQALCFGLLFGRRLMSAEKKEKLLRAVMDELNSESGTPDGKPPCMSFAQDADLIRAAFLQQYHMDLDLQRGRMSWRRFLLLLSGLTEATEFVQVVHLRTRPVPQANKHNYQERMDLIAAKQRVALKPETTGGQERFAMQLGAMFDALKAKAGERE